MSAIARSTEIPETQPTFITQATDGFQRIPLYVSPEVPSSTTIEPAIISSLFTAPSAPSGFSLNVQTGQLDRTALQREIDDLNRQISGWRASINEKLAGNNYPNRTNEIIQLENQIINAQGQIDTNMRLLG